MVLKNKDNEVLHSFHPLIAEWFLKRYGSPTEIQTKAWESIRREDHLLLSSPTGSGKTLAAFLWAINQLVTGVWPLYQTSVLYISPLKALNNDIRENLSCCPWHNFLSLYRLAARRKYFRKNKSIPCHF
jgi:ATP-dependent Lhr-like helicase